MKIVSVDVMQVPSGNAGASRGDWSPVIVRINTDEGISGFGEVGLAYGKGWRAGLGMVQDFAEVIIGEDPMNIEHIWETIFRKTFWGMGGGTVVYAGMSGIDIALWDIKGKALNQPVWQLLGGKTNDNLRVSPSQLQFNWGTKLDKQKLITPEEYAEVTRVAMAEGYDAIKVDPIIFSNQPDGKGPWKITGPLEHKVIKTVYDRVAAMREAGGDDLDIIIENHSNTDTTSAIQMGKALEDLRIFYFEEPCHPLNVQNMVEVKNRVNIPIASGERIYTAAIPTFPLPSSGATLASSSRTSACAAASPKPKRSATWATPMTAPCRSTSAAAPSPRRPPCRSKPSSPTSSSTSTISAP